MERLTDRVVSVGSLSRLQPRVNFANYMVTEPGQCWGPRVIPDSQLVFLLSGQATLHLGGNLHELSAGDGIFYGSKSPHVLASSAETPMTFCSIHFTWNSDHLEPVHPGSHIQMCALADVDIPTWTYLVELEGYGEIAFPHVYSNQGLDDLFLRIVREYRNEDLGYTIVMRSLLVELLMVILRSALRPATTPVVLNKVVPALQAIRSQPAVKWSMTTLAELCGYHPTYFCELFKLAIGQSPKHYIALERIRLAKTLLTERKTVDEVATELGYSSTHYFCRQFKQTTGHTPASYRKQSLEL